MCGIFAQIGSGSDAAQNTLEGLKKLEYRGYDSWGVAWLGTENQESTASKLRIKKQVGKIGQARLDDTEDQSLSSSLAFGHTRWATHGGVTTANAHPHVSHNGTVAVVHNGIIENYQDLKKRLLAAGVSFQSETDTEVLAQLIEENLKKEVSIEESEIQPIHFVQAVQTAFQQVTGLNAFVALHPATRTLVAVRSGSPLCVGKGENGFFICSDSAALAGLANQVVYLPEKVMAVCTDTSVEFLGSETSEKIVLPWEDLQVHPEDLALGEFPHFLLKEIHEQPQVVLSLAETASESTQKYAHWMGSEMQTLIGCGTAYHAAMLGKVLLMQIGGIRTQALQASEFGVTRNLLSEEDRVTFLSQSGETIDVVEHLAPLLKSGVPFGALVNRLGSTLERSCRNKILLGAGTEQSVLATKSFLAKFAVLYLLAMQLSHRTDDGQQALRKVVKSLQSVISDEYRQRHLLPLVQKLKTQKSIFIIGKGIAYPLALEAALKIKEVTYIHAEGFAGGELKHGVIALIEDGTPCIVLDNGLGDSDLGDSDSKIRAEREEAHATTVSYAQEVKSRGGWIIGVSHQKNEAFDVHLPVDDDGLLTGMTQSAVIQQLAYLLAVELGNDPDKPRNLAKSVTVR